MQYTVFWSHPYHGTGAFTVDAASAQIAGQEAADSLPEDFADDDQDELELSSIRDDLDIAVWEGTHTARPETDPVFVFA